MISFCTIEYSYITEKALENCKVANQPSVAWYFKSTCRCKARRRLNLMVADVVVACLLQSSYCCFFHKEEFCCDKLCVYIQALYHGVPQLCLSVFADQMYNAARLQYRGHGINLGRMRDVSVDKLVAGARDVINNRSYLAAVRAASVIFRSRPQNPRQRAAWWIDHVIQHGGGHMHSYALDMAWYEYLMLDLLAVLLVIPLILLTSAVTACICCCMRRHTATGTAHHKQQ